MLHPRKWRDWSLRLARGVKREHTERDRNPGLQRSELQAARRLAGDVVEVRRVTADHAAESDDAGKPACLRQRHGSERQLEGPGNLNDRDGVPGNARELELAERALEQPVRDLAVEAADDDRDCAAGAV